MRAFLMHIATSRWKLQWFAGALVVLLSIPLVLCNYLLYEQVLLSGNEKGARLLVSGFVLGIVLVSAILYLLRLVLSTIDEMRRERDKRKEIEQELCRTNEELEKKVRDRTAGLESIADYLRDEITERRQLEREVLRIEERERRRIGYDLHDDLGQQIAGIAFKLQLLQKKLKEKKISEAKDAERINELFENARACLRNLTRGIAPVIEDDGSDFIFSVKELLLNTERIFGVKCALQYDQNFKIVNKSEFIHHYRILQEAVGNAVKHSGSRFVEVTLDRNTEYVTLQVKDEGAGIQETGQHGMGMRIMRYRAEAIGGELCVKSDGNSGTVVQCVFRDLEKEAVAFSREHETSVL